MKTVFALLLLLSGTTLSAQHSTPDSADLRIVVAAGLTPVVPHRQQEIIFFNTLSTYRLPVSQPGGLPDDIYRISRLGHILQGMYGFSRTNRFCAGLEAQFTHLRADDDEANSPFQVLSGDTPAGGYAVHTLSAIGPRVRFTPFARHYEFTVQASALFPTGRRDYRTQLDEDRVRIGLQGSYLTPLPARFYVYASADIQVQAANQDRRQTTWRTPLNLYVFNKVADGGRQQVFLFANLGYGPSFEKEFKGSFRQVNYATYWGAGAQWAISPAWSLSASWQGLLGVDDNTTLEKGSYTAFGLGLRYAGQIFQM